MSECCMTREESNTQVMKLQAQELIEQAYQRGYKAGYEKGFKNGFDEGVLHPDINIIEKWIEQGRNEAWEAAGRLVAMEYWKVNDILSDGVLDIKTDEDIFIRLTASEAISKIEAYEQKKQEQDEIKVGDEVAFHHEDRPDTVMFVTKVAEDGFIDGMDAKGNLYAEKNPKNWTKTGRHLNEIVEVLKKMQEDE